MRRILFTLLVVAGLVPVAGAATLTVDRLFAAPGLQGETLRALRFSPDGRLISYLKPSATEPEVFDLWAYDIGRRQHRLLVAARTLAPQERALSAEEEARRERARTAALRGIIDYAWSPRGDGLLFPLDGDLYWYDLRAAPGSALRQLTDSAAFETDPRISPRGRYVSFIRNQDLHVLELATGRERALTTGGGGLISHGVAEFIAQEEMGRTTGYWWSPDERHVAFTRVDESPVAEVERFELHVDGTRVVRQRYPAAGTANARVTLGLVALADGTLRWLEQDVEDDSYLARVNWFPESDALLVQRQSRDQRQLDLLRYALDGTAPRLLFSEARPTWVELHSDLLFLPARRQFVWASQRSGNRHLYLYGYDGQLARSLTGGPWDVEAERQQAALRGVDEQRGRLYFMATEKSPLERHLYYVSLQGGAPRRVTQADGWHEVSLAPDLRGFVQTRSEPARPPQVSLHDLSGRRIAWLAENRLDESHPYQPYRDTLEAPEFGTLAAADGTTLHWQLQRPQGFDPTRRYPVIIMVYGGPGVQTVQRRFGGRSGSLIPQLLAQRGYAVFMLDNRGSGGRGQAFAEALHGRLGGVEVADQLRGVDFLRTLPWIDPDRVGVYGWSYGGYLTLRLMSDAPGIYRAGVAGAPVTDWRLYDTHYTERYLGHPALAPTNYEASSVFTQLEHLDGRLLLVHGMADDNVLFTHTTRLIDQLTRLDKRFEVLPYPGARHAALSFADTGRHGWKTIIDFFDRHLLGAGELP